MIRISENHNFGGVSYCVSSIADLTALPSEYRELISEIDIAALTDHSGLFGELSDKCRFGPMKSWLRMVAASEGVTVTAYIDEMNQRVALVNTFGVSICMTPSAIPKQTSIRLRDVFDIVGSIHHIGYGQPPFLEIGVSDVVEVFDDRLLEYSSAPASGSYVTEFYNADCGDRLLAVGNQVFHYHLSGAICEAGSLDNTLTEYFKLLSGFKNSFEMRVPYERVRRKQKET